MLALALILMCLSYVLMRTLLAWPAVLFQSTAPQEALAELSSPKRFLLELIPLPIAPLISPAFAQFGWTRFLTLSLILIGTGALLRRMVETIHSLQDEVATIKLVDEIKASLRKTPPNTQALLDLARQFCARIVPAQCEIGLYNHAMTQVTVQSSLDEGKSSSLMYIPLTPLWEWIGQQKTPILLENQSQFTELSLTLPALGSGEKLQSALLAPILAPSMQTVDEEQKREHRPVGAFLLQSAAAGAFDTLVIERISTLGKLIGEAIQHTRALSARTLQAMNQRIAQQIQADLLLQKMPTIEGWDIGVAWRLSERAKGVWCDFFPLPAKEKFVLGEPQAQGLPASLTSLLVKALIRSRDDRVLIDQLKALEAMNTYLLATRNPTALLCASIGPEHIVSLINAGCASPLWWHSEHARVEVLKSENPLLGVSADSAGEEKSIALAINDVLVLYTSSLLQVSNGKEAFGEQRLIEALSQLAERPASELAQAIVAQASTFRSEGNDRKKKDAPKETPFESDVLVAVLARRQAPQRKEK
jgi:serine phosphatase RsbU (regulator of sigma subunit)